MHEAIYHYVDPANKAIIGFYILGIGTILYLLINLAVGGRKSMDKEPSAIDYLFLVFLLPAICFIAMITAKANATTEGKTDLHEFLQKNYNIDLSQTQTKQLYDHLQYTEIPITHDGEKVVIRLK